MKHDKKKSTKIAMPIKRVNLLVQDPRYLKLPNPGKKKANPNNQEADTQFPLGIIVRQTHLAFNNTLQQRLKDKKKKLTAAQWVFLRILWNEDALNQKELSERVGVHPTTAVPAITILERIGYVSRERSNQDRRHVTVRLTDAGKALAKELIPVVLEQNKKSLQGISQADAEKLMQLLMTVQRNLLA